MSSKKVLIMPSRSQPSPEGVPPENEAAVLAPGPISPGDIRSLYMVLDIQRNLGGMEHAIKILESTNTSHGEKLQQIARQADRTDVILTILEKGTVERLGKIEERAQRLERVAHFAEFIGLIMVGSGVAYIIRLLYLLFSK